MSQGKDFLLFCDKCGWNPGINVAVKNRCDRCRQSLHIVTGESDEVEAFKNDLIDGERVRVALSEGVQSGQLEWSDMKWLVNERLGFGIIGRVNKDGNKNT